MAKKYLSMDGNQAAAHVASEGISQQAARELVRDIARDTCRAEWEDL